MDESENAPPKGRERRSWLIAAVLFTLTFLSVFATGANYELTSTGSGSERSLAQLLRILPTGASFAIPLLTILVVHEFGHYLAAKIHRVPVSPPYFLPVWGSPFGTLGAIISMRHRIRSRNALLDIGAAGPLAGLIVALPVLAYGIATSKVISLSGAPTEQPAYYVQEGQNLVYLALKALLVDLPPGADIQLNSVAFAGWVGMFVTAVNLIPIGQLDGGHVAYALFGTRQDRIAYWLHRALLLPVAYNAIRYVFPPLLREDWEALGTGIGNSIFYVVWLGLLALMRRLSGTNHPPTDPSTLSPKRKIVAWLCLALFALLFMPTPWSVHEIPK